MIEKCLECGKSLEQIIGKRAKKFCNSTCRSNYWQKQQTKKANGKEEKKSEQKEDQKKPPVKSEKTFEILLREAKEGTLNVDEIGPARVTPAQRELILKKFQESTKQDV